MNARPRTRTTIPAVITIVIVGALLLAGSPPSAAQPSTRSVTKSAAGDALFYNHWQNTYAGQERVLRTLETRLLHETFAADPTVPSGDVVRIIVDARKQLTSHDSPEKDFWDETKYDMKVLKTVLDIVKRPETKAASAVFGATEKIMNLIAATRGDDIAASRRYTDTVDWGNLGARALGDSRATITSIRNSSNPGEKAAFDQLYLGELNVIAAASTADIIEADPQIRANLQLLDALGENTGDLAVIVEDGVDMFITSETEYRQLTEAKLDEILALLAEQTENTGDIDTDIVSHAETAADRQAAIDAAKQQAETYRQTIEPVKATLNTVTALLSLVDPAAAQKISTVTGTLFQIGDSINEWAAATAALDLTGTLTSFSTIAMATQIIGAVINLTGAFGEPAPTVDELLMESIGALRGQLAVFASNVEERFNRIDHTLNLIYSEMGRQFNLIDTKLGFVQQGVDDIRRELTILAARVADVEYSIYLTANTLSNRDFRQAVNLWVGYQDRTGQPLPAASYINAAEPTLYTWAVENSRDRLGEGFRSTADADLTAELGYPLDGNINYLSQLPAEKWGLEPLSDSNLASYVQWTAAARAYAALVDESPDTAASLPSTAQRIDDVTQIGRDYLTATAKISDPTYPLWPRLATLYQQKQDGYMVALARREQQYRDEIRLDPFGTAWQNVASEDLPAFPSISACDSSQMNGALAYLIPHSPTSGTDETVAKAIRAAIPAPYLVQRKLDPQMPMTMCIRARWATHRYDFVTGPPTATFPRDEQRTIYGNVSWEIVTTTGTMRISTSATRTSPLTPICTYIRDTHQPVPAADKACRPYQLGGPSGLGFETSPYTAWVMFERVLLASRMNRLTFTVNDGWYYRSLPGFVNAQLSQLKPALYRRLADISHPDVAAAANELDGAAMLIKAYVEIGYPLGVSNDEVLAALVRGSDTEALPTSRFAQASYVAALNQASTPGEWNVRLTIERETARRLTALLTVTGRINDGAATRIVAADNPAVSITVDYLDMLHARHDRTP